MESYTKLIDKHKGETAFVVGAGTSLYPISKSKEFDEIHKHVVISVNSSILAMPWCAGKSDKRYWISNYAMVRRWSYWKDVVRTKATKIVRNSWEKYYAEIPNFLVFEPRPTSEDVVDPDDTGLCYCSSVPSGTDLAIQMGCKRIFLLGVDHYFDQFRSHYWHYWPHRQWLRGPTATHDQQTTTFKINALAFEALAKFAKHKKTKIYNCSPKSQIKAFPRITFEEALEIINGRHNI